MEMCYEGALVMPSSYAVMNEEEMTYVEGGAVSLQMSYYYYQKYYCNLTAEGLLASGQVVGMTKLQIAQEIFAHAVAYKYTVAAMHYATGIAKLILGKIKDKASVVDIEDYGDSRAGFMKAYSIIWNVYPASV